MTLKRYMPVNCQYGAEMMEHGIGDWCDWEAVQEHVKAQRADAQRQALLYCRQWTAQGIATGLEMEYKNAMADLQHIIDTELQRIESVSQVDGGGA